MTKKLALRGVAPAVLVGWCLGFSGAAQAPSIIYDNGAPNLALFGGISDLSSSTQLAEDFTLSAGANIVTDVHWWGGYRFDANTPASDDFTIRFYETDPQTNLPPLTPLFVIPVGDVGRTPIGSDTNPSTVYEYWVDIPAIQLDPDRKYWLSIVNNTPPRSTTDDDWFWERASFIGTLATLVFPFQQWQANSSGAFAFNLTGTGPQSQPVEIDIKPGSDPNSINCRHNGVIPVAILTTSTAMGDPIVFDASIVDPSTVAFGPSAASAAHRRAHIQDVDGDGDMDMVLHFRQGNTGIQCGDVEACLTGQTTDGTSIEGCDAIRTVGG